MQSANLVSSFAQIAHDKGMERDTLQLIIEDVFRAMIRKRYGADEAFEIIFNPDSGDIQILHIREVVEDWDLHDPVTQIEETDAKDFDEDFEAGDEVASELSLEDFGRRAVMTARQTFRQRIRDIEKEKIYAKYSELIGEIVVGEIYQTRRREVLVVNEDAELVLPRNEQIYKDRYRKGDMLRSVVKEVQRDAGNSPQVIISRSSPALMERLFELEVPEVYDGIVEIKRIVREPGDRAKVAVMSHDDRIDPVGACVGMKGVRIHAVVRELANENIDVLLWTDDPFLLIKRALSPASPVTVTINEDLVPPRAKVVVKADEVSQAIGRGGINIRLASKLCGYEIDVYREIAEDEEDIDIEEFGDELAEETVQRLKEIGCDTGRAVMELSLDELQRRTGFARDTAEGVMQVIELEFERGEEAAAPPAGPMIAGHGIKEFDIVAVEDGEDIEAAAEEESVPETTERETVAESGDDKTTGAADGETDAAATLEEVQTAAEEEVEAAAADQEDVEATTAVEEVEPAAADEEVEPTTADEEVEPAAGEEEIETEDEEEREAVSKK